MSVAFISSDCVSRDDVPDGGGADNAPRGDGEPAVPLGLLNLATILRRRRSRDVSITALRPSPPDLVGSVEAVKRLAGEVLDRDPDWVGISTRCDTYGLSLRTAQELKWRRPGLPIVLGGPQATATAQATLDAFDFVDVVARGEAEEIIEQIDDALGGASSMRGIPSLVYRERGAVRSNRSLTTAVDLDSLPYPDYTLVPWLERVPSIPVDAGRGCPFHCTYCSTNLFFANRYRLRSTESLLALIQWTVRSTGKHRLQFTHDNLTARPRQFDEFCTALRDARLDIEWSCSARLDCLNPDRLDLMRQAGCVAIFIGLETGSASMQAEIRKNLNLRGVDQRLRDVVARIPEFTTSFIMGFPTETAADLSATADLMAEVREISHGQENVQLHMLSPTPGTPIFMRWAENLRLLAAYETMAQEAPLGDFVVVDGADDSMFSWVSAHPDLFGNYYYIEPQCLSRTFQISIYTTLQILQRSFPNTARLMRSSNGDEEPSTPLVAATALAQEWDRHPWPPAEGADRVFQALVDALVASRSSRSRRVLDVLRVENAVKEIRRGQARRLTVRTTWDVAHWLRGSGSREDAWAAPAVQSCILLSQVEGSTPLIARVPSQVSDLVERAASLTRPPSDSQPDGEQTHETPDHGAERQRLGAPT